MDKIREVTITTGYGSETLELCADCTAQIVSDLGQGLVKSKAIRQGKCEWCGESTLVLEEAKG